MPLTTIRSRKFSENAFIFRRTWPALGRGSGLSMTVRESMPKVFCSSTTLIDLTPEKRVVETTALVCMLRVPARPRHPCESRRRPLRCQYGRCSGPVEMTCVVGKREPMSASEVPAAEQLETFPNQYAGRNYTIEIVCPEFTSLCPMT